MQVFFATLPIAAKIALRELSPGALVLVRCAVAALLFYIIHRATSRERIRGTRDYLLFAFYSILGVSLNQLFYIAGLAFTTATAAQMLIAGGPAVTLLVAIIAGREAASPMKWFGIILAGAGAMLLVNQGTGAGHVFGNILIIINMIAYSAYLVLARDLLKRYQPLTVITWIFIFGVVGVLPFGLTSAIRELPATSLETRLAVGWIILFPTVAAYYLNVWALTHVESSLVSTFVYLQPVMTALLAMPILGERPTLRMIPSALLIFAGVGVAIWSGRRADHRPHPEDQRVIET